MVLRSLEYHRHTLSLRQYAFGQYAFGQYAFGQYAFGMRLQPLQNNYQPSSLVPQEGPGRSWNVVSEESDSNDAFFVSVTLINHLATFANVVPSFSIIGSSNGGGLTNRILVECDDPRIQRAVTEVSQLNTHQFFEGSFYIGGPTNAYTEVKKQLHPRAVLSMVGMDDHLIPAMGGASNIGIRGRDWLRFNSWRESAFAFARAFGYSGSPAGDQSIYNDPKTSRVGYLEGRVQAVLFKGAGHGILFDQRAGPTAQHLVRRFLERPDNQPDALSQPASEDPSVPPQPPPPQPPPPGSPARPPSHPKPPSGREPQRSSISSRATTVQPLPGASGASLRPPQPTRGVSLSHQAHEAAGEASADSAGSSRPMAGLSSGPSTTSRESMVTLLGFHLRRSLAVALASAALLPIAIVLAAAAVRFARRGRRGRADPAVARAVAPAILKNIAGGLSLTAHAD